MAAAIENIYLPMLDISWCRKFCLFGRTLPLIAEINYPLNTIYLLSRSNFRLLPGTFVATSGQNLRFKPDRLPISLFIH